MSMTLCDLFNVSVKLECLPNFKSNIHKNVFIV